MSGSSLSGKALITGASGFIGSRLKDALTAQGVETVAIRRPGSPSSKTGRSVEAQYGDIEKLKGIFREENPDYVFHVAGATKGVSYDDFRDANVVPTVNLAMAANEVPPSRFVMVSSLAAYGPSPHPEPHREVNEPAPIEHYGRSKLEAERALGAHAKFPWTIVRPSGVYGPGDADYFNLFKEVSRGRNVFFGNRDRWFSKIFIDDCVRAILLSASSAGTENKGYFICDDDPVTWETFQEAIVRASGKRALTLSLPESLVSVAAIGGELMTRLDGKPRLFNRQKATMGAQKAWVSTSAALRADTSFVPSVGLDEGVRRSFDWYRKQGWL